MRAGWGSRIGYFVDTRGCTKRDIENVIQQG